MGSGEGGGEGGLSKGLGSMGRFLVEGDQRSVGGTERREIRDGTLETGCNRLAKNLHNSEGITLWKPGLCGRRCANPLRFIAIDIEPFADSSIPFVPHKIFHLLILISLFYSSSVELGRVFHDEFNAT